MIQMRYIVIPIFIFLWGLWTKAAFKQFKKGAPEATAAEITWLIVHGIAIFIGFIVGGNHLLDFIIEHW
jgi:hypothetical protein